ncbi:putative toxin-antitoxin system toxin component, PIN family [Marinobacter sp.]|uniref:putative toxin-antitoxin system toxin component, PIN family n=1 Tax=Marinobacter sp. TaxID=50741 RepID=UPI000C551349|nr:putative toxin-antitoxin system toxin component, PIN family [Marinobacter sp.]MAO13053.1 putative toxin-antitoxin system toxin component, PIN family [Marinobacter sp.]|tara:strand:- start:991 stop:1422 length:432 start_codon:yes stop_codon:yes gene_type:complete
MASIQVVLDTNVIISGLAYPSSAPGRVMQAWRSGALDVVLSEYILDEIRRVLPRLSHRHGMTDAEIDDLVDILSFLAELVDPVKLPDDAVRDKNDTPVLGTLVAGMQAHGVDYLITGDKDLLALAGQFPVVTPADFWARHGGL